MSFDQSPHRQQAPPDLSHNRLQQQQAQTQDGTIPPPAPTFATSPMGRGEHPSYAGPSLPPPPKLAPQQQQAPVTDYGRQDPYGSHQAWERQPYSLPQTVPPPPFAASRQYPTQLQPPEGYVRPGGLPLPTDLAKNGNASPFPVQPGNTAFDPIRSEMASHRPPPAMPPIVKQESQQQHGYYYDRPQPAPPLMSISQLLSDAPPATSRPQQSYPSSMQKPAHPPAQMPTSAAAAGPVQESQPVHQQQQPPPPPPSSSAPSTMFRNGIKNLLNSDNEDAYQMGDSDTDTDEMATMHAKTNPPPSSYQSVSNADGQSVPVKHEYNGAQKLPPTGTQFDTSIYDKGSPLRGRNTRREFELSDDSSVEDQRVPREKSLTERTLEELQLSDDSDDEEIFNTHREEMVQYMIDVYRRREDVIHEYEKKRANRHKMISEHLQRIYEKRYGPELSKGLNGNTVSTASSLLLLAAKEDKEREGRRLKKAKHRHTQGVFEDEEDPEYANLLMYTSDPKLSPRKIEETTRRVWLDIARKDIPRMNRILTRVQATRAGNCKKVAQYCQKEVKRSATKNGRLNRDVQSKAKRAQKEMLLFWRKNEKEERELRKKAEKEALERAKQEEERREAQRQARKLNFLITQTELYSHFIGRKIKADTGEDDETAVPASERVSPEPSGAAAVEVDKELDITAGEQTMEAIDFDEDDEEKLREHARRGAQNALAKQRERTRAFDEGARERRQAAGDDISMSAAQLDTMNFQDPTSMGTEEIKQPSILMCQLKSYQLKGLNWLANLYEQGINGILADEMGLGKTVQSISLMAYLAETHNIWGPFLVIAPSSTLHNWQQEISKFVPSFRALPYWGNPKDRKTLRQFWSKKQLYSKDAPFHVVITSYQLVLMDVTYFQRVKWQYMVLDEAQAIKSSSSARWKQLLGFHCRNRLLLTGTPIQNSMQELWALLHFIMPTLFDSHEEFSEWFSKDIESHAENKGTLNEHQLRRLHMILKPFMLRRIKKNVQHELSEKIEVEVYCYLTARQRALYKALKEKISVSELLEKATSLNEESMDSLMNLVMQFRKVCNHPELFERADVEAPLAFCAFSETGVALSKEPRLYCPYSSRSHIKYHIPKRLYRNGGILRVPGPESNAGFSTRYLDNLMNIWSPDYIHNSMLSNGQDSAFSFLRFVDTSPQEASYLFKQSLIARWISYLAHRDQRSRRRFYLEDEESYPDAPVNTFAKLLITEVTSPLSHHVATSGSIMENFINIAYQNTHILKRFDQCYIPGARSVPADIICSDRSFENDQNALLFEPSIRACFFGSPQYIHDSMRREQAELSIVARKSEGRGIMTVSVSGHGFSMMRVPAMRDLILDSGKLATLDRLLEKLKAEGHRCLIYFQMTRMIDLMEEYLAYKQYKYLRLDGSSKISDRRDMVQDWQTRPEIFIFLLSTRAGGLGINLTAADTVIFYDSDWNPTVDQQAMDRAHRLGQTKQVTVYRLITKNTIEERILQRAKQKDEIQKVVISGGEFKQVDFKPREIVSLLLDDEELDNKLQMQLKRKADEEEKKGGRAAKRNKKSNTMSEAAMDRLMSAGGDTLPEDEAAAGGSGSAKKKGRIGRPRTNISFTG